DPQLAAIIAAHGAGVVVMHMLGEPERPERDPRYRDVVEEAFADLQAAVERARKAGIRPEAIIVDPGIGVAKRTEHNLALLQGLPRLAQLEQPLLIGASRTSVIGNVLEAPVEERLEGTVATTAVAAALGAHIVRVHDIKENVRAARMAD